MKTISLTQLRRDPVAAIKAVRNGRGVRVTRRSKVIVEVNPADGMRDNPLFDANYLKLHSPPLPRPLKRGELGVVALLKQDRDER